MATPQFSCSTFSDRGTTYFAAVTLHGAQDGAEGSADLAVTDGTAAWTAQGASPLLAGCHAALCVKHAYINLKRYFIKQHHLPAVLQG